MITVGSGTKHFFAAGEKKAWPISSKLVSTGCVRDSNCRASASTLHRNSNSLDSGARLDGFRDQILQLQGALLKVTLSL